MPAECCFWPWAAKGRGLRRSMWLEAPTPRSWPVGGAPVQQSAELCQQDTRLVELVGSWSRVVSLLRRVQAELAVKLPWEQLVCIKTAGDLVDLLLRSPGSQRGARRRKQAELTKSARASGPRASQPSCATSGTR